MKILITAKTIPDIDGVACAVAYSEYLSQSDSKNRYVAAFDTAVHIEADFVCKQLDIPVQIISSGDSFDQFILVDMSESFGLPPVCDSSKVIEVIDHRMFPSYQSFPNARFRIEPVGAAATQIAEFFMFNPLVNLSSNTAALLLCAIYSNTVNFKADVTTFRDHRAKGYLESIIDPAFTDLPEQMFSFKSDYVLQNQIEVLKSDYKSGGTRFGLDENVAIFQIETGKSNELLNHTEDLLKNMALVAEGQKYLLLIVQDAESGRTLLVSNSPKIGERLLKTNLKFDQARNNVSDSDILIIPQITMRKSILAAIQ